MNEALKKTAAQHGVKLWQIADALGVTDSTFSRKLRKELSTEQVSEIEKIILRLEAAKDEGI